MENLEKEHQELAEKTKEFSMLIEMILQDAVVPQDIFIAQLEDFIESQKRHLELEERKILPLIEELLLLKTGNTSKAYGQRAKTTLYLVTRLRIATNSLPSAFVKAIWSLFNSLKARVSINLARVYLW